MRSRRSLTMLLGTALALGAAACSGPMTTEEAVVSFQTAHPEASRIDAECVIDDLIEAVEPDPDAAVASGEVPTLEAELLAEPRRDEFALDQARAMFRCGLRQDLEVQLAQQLSDAGLDAERTDCVAAELVPELTEGDFNVLLGSEMTDEFFERMFDAAQACDALPA